MPCFSLLESKFSLRYKSYIHGDIQSTSSAIAKKPLAAPIYAAGIDALGGEPLMAMLKQLKPGGVVSACGMASDPEFAANFDEHVRIFEVLVSEFHECLTNVFNMIEIFNRINVFFVI